MLVQHLMSFTISLWPFLFGHSLLSLVSLSCTGELQRSCSETVAERFGQRCQLACQCRGYPPFPPPPPPPPPPRLVGATVVEPLAPLSRPWWMEVEIIVMGTVGCISLLLLLSALIICYKAMKRKPLRKEENGTSRGEYAMSIRNKKALGSNNTVV